MMIIYAIKKREQKTLTKWLCQLNSFSCWFFPFKMHTLCLSTVSQCENLIFFYVRKLIVFWFNEKSTLVGHFVLSPRAREKRDGRDERERQGRKRNRNESEETEEIKISPPLPLPATRIAGLAQLYAIISWTPLPDCTSQPLYNTIVGLHSINHVS